MVRRMLVAITIAVAVSTLLVPNAGDAAVEPQNPSDLVTLIASGLCPQGGSDMSFRVLSDASIVPFSIPEGRVFVITSWQWATIFTSRVDHWEGVELSLQNPNGNFRVVGVAGNSTPGAQGSPPSNQFTSNNASLVNMIAVKPGVHVCVNAASNARPSAVVHGFLAPDR